MRPNASWQKSKNRNVNAEMQKSLLLYNMSYIEANDIEIIQANAKSFLENIRH